MNERTKKKTHTRILPVQFPFENGKHDPFVYAYMHACNAFTLVVVNWIELNYVELNW